MRLGVGALPLGALFLALAAWPAGASPPDVPASQGVSLNQALDLALRNYPSLRAAQARVSAAQAQVDLARAAYLPRADWLLQANRATLNNTTGLLLPQGPLPSLSGPVLDPLSATTDWGSAAGVLASWDVWDFGLKAANLEAARAEEDQTRASATLTELEVQSQAANAFLSLLEARATVKAAQANLNRTQVFLATVRSLAETGLRPGADLSRASAEVARARIQLIQTTERETAARHVLAQALGVPEPGLSIRDSGLQHEPVVAILAAQPLSTHPAARSQAFQMETVHTHLRAISASYWPTLALKGALFARGSEAGPGASVGGGLIPSRPNAALGLTMAMPLLDFPALQAKKRAEVANESRERARYDELVLRLAEHEAEAEATYRSAGEIAQQTPALLEAARTTDLQVETRYKAGLAPLTDVADAQRLLTQADVEDALARLRVWRALLTWSVARGDLVPFRGALASSQGDR